MPRIVLPTGEIRNEKTFHVVCQRVFGFPDLYDHTMTAWIDCLSCLDDPAAEMTSFTLAPGELLVVVVPDSAGLKDEIRQSRVRHGLQPWKFSTGTDGSCKSLAGA